VEAAYARGTMFDRRRVLMNDWASYIETRQQPGKQRPAQQDGERAGVHPLGASRLVRARRFPGGYAPADEPLAFV